MRVCVCSPSLNRYAKTVQVASDSVGETIGFASHVVDDDGNNRPTKFLDPAPPCFVPEHFTSPHMPVDAFVFSRQTDFRPGEVDAAQFATTTVDGIGVRVAAARGRSSRAEPRFP